MQGCLGACATSIRSEKRGPEAKLLTQNSTGSFYASIASRAAETVYLLHHLIHALSVFGDIEQAKEVRSTCLTAPKESPEKKLLNGLH